MNTENRSRFEDWDDTTVLLALSHLTQDLLEGLPAEQRGVVENEEDARGALLAFVREYGEPGEAVPGDHFAPERMDEKRVGRELLDCLAADPAVGKRAESLLAEPPEDAQMAGLDLTTSVVILGALVSWLQTHVEFSVERKGKNVNWSFKLRKGAASPSVVAQVVKKLLGAIG